MNIAFAFVTPFNPMYGGVERVTDTLCRELKRRGHKVFYFHLCGAERYDNYTAPADGIYYADISENYSSALRSYHCFIRDHQIDVIINHDGLLQIEVHRIDSTLYSKVQCKESALPVVISVMHNDPLLNYNHLFKQISTLKDGVRVNFFKFLARCVLYPYKKYKYLKERRRCAKYSLTHSDALILLSDRYKHALKILCEDLHSSNIIIKSIPNPLPPTFGSIKHVSRKNWLLYVGRLDYNQKRPDRVLSIWARLYKQFPEWELHIVGDGACRSKLEKMAHKLPRVFFEGWQDPTPYYEQAKILLMTSNFEGFPMVLPEAMSHGVVPVVYNSFAASEDIIDDNLTGFLVKPFKLNAFFKKISLVMDSETQWNMMSMAAYHKAKLFAAEDICIRWETLMDQLIQDKMQNN